MYELRSSKGLHRKKSIGIAVLGIAIITLALVVSLYFSGNLPFQKVAPSSTLPPPADYIGFPNIRFTSAYSNLNPIGGYTINLQIKNIGPATATFDPATVLLNEQQVSAITGASATFSQTTLVTNASATGTITLPSTGFTSGMAVRITIQDTRHGLQFSQVVTLP
jgi:hypothetical protein